MSRRIPAALLEPLDHRAREIVTPEGVPLQFHVARSGDRLFAFCLDLFFIVLLVVAISIPCGFLLALLPGDQKGYASALWLLTFFLLRNFYFTWFEIRWNGATPGKRWFKCRVIARRGGSLPAESVFARNLTREVEVFLPLLPLLQPDSLGISSSAAGTLLATTWLLLMAALPLFNRDRLRVGDLLAGTMVVEAPAVRLLPDVVAERPPGDEPRYAFTPEQLAIYGIFELQVLEDVLRRKGIDRSQAMETVAQKIRDKIGWDPDRPVRDVKQFLLDFYTAQRAVLERKMVLGRRRLSKYDGS